MRHAQGNATTSTLHAQITDQNGTAYADVSLAAGNAVVFSRTDPFGVRRGAESNGWRSHEGYIGGGDDASSGLVHLGAREYDPSTGRFLSADPVLDLADPVQMNGYVYCENNPVTYADPSGLASDAGGGGGGVSSDPSASEVAEARRTIDTSVSQVILSMGGEMLKEFVGWKEIKNCFSSGDLWSCGKMIVSAIPWTKWGKIPSVLATAGKIARAIIGLNAAKAKAHKVIEAAKKAAELARKAKEAKRKAAERAAQIKKAAQQAKTRATKAAAKKTGNAVQKAKKTIAKAGEAIRTGYQKVRAKLGGSCKTSNSFVSGTLVLMADGTTKPIQNVTNGDKVLATDPETGETAVETVTAEITGEGVKHLVKVTIDTDGDKGDATASVTATDGHPIWVPELDDWIDATDLKSGQWLQAGAGTYVQITAVERWTAQQATVHNLTVSDVHTYYVLAGEVSVLVHNCGGSQPGHSELCRCDPENPRSEVVLDAGSFEQARNQAMDIVGPIDTGSWQRRQGTMESAVDTFGRDTGFTATSGGNYRSFRLDTDPRIGTHINVMTGKGALVRKTAIRFPGGSILTWLRRNVWPKVVPMRVTRNTFRTS